MSEEGGFWEKAGRRLRLIRRREEPASPENQELSPEQKAQRAFFTAVEQSLTPQKLEAGNRFEPPHKTFDISKLGDGTVFRVQNSQSLDMGDPEPLVAERWNYGAIVKDSDGNQLLYYPKNVVRATGDQLLFDDMWSVEQLDKGSSNIEVQEVEMGEMLLDWEKPEGTISKDFFIAGADISWVRSIELELHAVEVVISGEKTAQKVANKVEQTQVASSGQLSPKPTGA